MNAGGGDSDRRRLQLARDQARGFNSRFGYPPAVVVTAPGRINLIGEHTDYNAGMALPAAIDDWVCVALSPRSDDTVRVVSGAFGETVERRLDDAGSASEWARIPVGAASLWAEATGSREGIDATIGGTLPVGAGVSSSAAVEMALLNALRVATTAALDDRQLVLLAQRVEHEHLGVATGIMDQYTSQFGETGKLLLIDFAASAHDVVPWPFEDWVLLLLDSGVRHQLADSAYDERVAETREALVLVQAEDSAVETFPDVTGAHVEGMPEGTPRNRLRHYVGENERVRAAVSAIGAGDVDRLGELILASHASLRDDYEVSCPELDALVDAAVAEPGCAGARMMGGGFGGCTINLVRADAAEALHQKLAPGFERRFGYAPGAATYRPAAGVRVHPPGTLDG